MERDCSSIPTQGTAQTLPSHLQGSLKIPLEHGSRDIFPCQPLGASTFITSHCHASQESTQKTAQTRHKEENTLLYTPVQTLSELISPPAHLHPQPCSSAACREPRSRLQDMTLIPCDWVTLPQPLQPPPGLAGLWCCTAPESLGCSLLSSGLMEMQNKISAEEIAFLYHTSALPRPAGEGEHKQHSSPAGSRAQH